jgi:hypothetical protein
MCHVDVDAWCVIELLDQPFIGLNYNIVELAIEKLKT